MSPEAMIRLANADNTHFVHARSTWLVRQRVPPQGLRSSSSPAVHQRIYYHIEWITNVSTAASRLIRRMPDKRIWRSVICMRRIQILGSLPKTCLQNDNNFRQINRRSKLRRATKQRLNEGTEFKSLRTGGAHDGVGVGQSDTDVILFWSVGT